MRILALSIAGMPHRWMDIDRAAYYVATDKVAWTLGDPAMILHGGTQRTSGLRSELALPPVIALARSEATRRRCAPTTDLSSPAGHSWRGRKATASGTS